MPPRDHAAGDVHRLLDIDLARLSLCQLRLDGRDGRERMNRHADHIAVEIHRQNRLSRERAGRQNHQNQTQNRCSHRCLLFVVLFRPKSDADNS